MIGLQDPAVLERIAESLERIQFTWPTVLAALALVIVGIVLSRVANRYLRRLADQTDPSSATTLRLAARLSVFGILFFAAWAALGILGFDVLPMLWILAVVVVILAFALRPVFESFAAGVTLQTLRPFAAGDEVHLWETEGTVREITSRSVYVETFTGEHVYIPNREVLGHPIINYTGGSARKSILDISLDFDTDLEHAENVITAAVRSTPGVHAEPDPIVRFDAFGTPAVAARIHFWHNPEVAAARDVRHRVVMAVHAAVGVAGVAVAYPERVLHWGDQEPGRTIGR